jgi:hypothetical protein
MLWNKNEIYQKVSVGGRIGVNRLFTDTNIYIYTIPNSKISYCDIFREPHLLKTSHSKKNKKIMPQYLLS